MKTETAELTTINPQEFGIEPAKAKELTAGLSTIIEERASLSEMYKDVIKMEISEESIPKFRELRLKIRDNRTKGFEKWHKVNKAFFLAGGRFVDAIKNKEVAENERMESQLMEGEKHFENLEKQRIEKLQAERMELISQYVEDTTAMNLGEMQDDVWEAYFTAKKQQHTERIEAEKKAEAERLENERLDKLERDRQIELAPYSQFNMAAPNLRTLSEEDYQEFLNELKEAKATYEAEQEKIRLENERLQKEAEEKEKELAAERKAAEEKAAKERKAHEAALKAEREERERIKKEIKEVRTNELRPYIVFIRDYASLIGKNESDYRKEFNEIKKGAEQQWEYDREQTAKKEAEKARKAPIKKQLTLWVDGFETPEPPVKNEKAEEIKQKFNAFKKWAKSEIEQL